MIKTIIFDLGNVIVPYDYATAYEQLERACEIPKEEMPALIFSSELYKSFEMGLISTQEFFTEVTKVLRLKMEHDQFCKTWSSIYLPTPLISEELIAALAAKYRLLALSDTNPIHFPVVLATYPLLKRFDRYVLSYQVGAVKPSFKIFQAAIDEAKCLPDESLFIDDVLLNVEGARRFGMNAVQFKSQEQLEKEFVTYGVAW